MAEFYKTKLKNGMSVLFEKRNLPIASVLISTKAGAAHETADKKGLAHFAEHMPFKATATRNTQELSSAIEKVGGILNAFTSDEITAFWCKIPSKHFSEGFEIISDLVQNPKFDRKDIEKERNVILSEISRCHDNPQHYLFDKTKGLLYGEPFGMPVLGLKKTVSGIRREDFLKWHGFCCPPNLTISVVGSVSFDDVKNAAKCFGKTAMHFELPKPTISRKSGNFMEKRHGLDQSHFTLGLHMPTLRDEKRYSSEIFNAILGEGMSSKLFREVREKRGLAYSVKSFLEQERDYGHAIIYAGIEKKNVKKVKEIVLKEIKSIGKTTKRELEDAKEQKIGNWELELESCDKTAVSLAIQEMTTKAEDFYSYPEKISEARLEDVRSLAKIKRYSLAVLVPK